MPAIVTLILGILEQAVKLAPEVIAAIKAVLGGTADSNDPIHAKVAEIMNSHVTSLEKELEDIKK